MIYVISPNIADYKRSCKELQNVKLEWDFNGLPKGKGVVRWIRTWGDLVGHTILKKDQVVYGKDFYKLTKSEQETIQTMIRHRTEKA